MFWMKPILTMHTLDHTVLILTFARAKFSLEIVIIHIRIVYIVFLNKFRKILCCDCSLVLQFLYKRVNSYWVHIELIKSCLLLCYYKLDRINCLTYVREKRLLVEL